MCIYPSGKPCPCTANVELVMNFIARKPPEGRVVSCKKKKNEEKCISFEKSSLPHCESWSELVNSLSILTTETSIQNRRKVL